MYHAERAAFAAAEGDRACAVAERLTRKGWPLAAKSLEGSAQMQCSLAFERGNLRVECEAVANVRSVGITHRIFEQI